jgi:TolB-like protein/tetratricopeptide (TPR) repeat protein
MEPKKFFAELKRRKVYSVAVAYAVVGSALIQLVSAVFPSFEIPPWGIRLAIVLIAIGFPVALVFAWIYDFTRQGIKRTDDVDLSGKIDIVPAAPSNEKSIAVLPFKDLTAAEDRDYLGDGIAEEIQTALAKIDGLRVVARRSSFWFKDKQVELSEIASKLNVDHVLEGSIRRDGNRVRVSAELTECCNGFTLWSETFEREFQGIFALQDEITRSIVEALKLKLAISAPPSSRLGNTEAYELYLQGLFWSDKSMEDALRRSLEYFERTLEKDPHFSRAYTGMAKSWLWLADAYEPPLQAYPKVREAATSALKIDNDDAEAHVYLGEAKRILDWDMDGAAVEYRRAVELDPNSTPSNYFSAAFWAARGEREQALTYLRRTAKIDPASLWVSNFACELYRYFGLYEEAQIEGERAMQLDPTFIYGAPALAALYRETGRVDEAIALFKRAENFTGIPTFGRAIIYGRMGRRDEALELLHAIIAKRSYTPGDAIAHVYVALGEHDEAIRYLELACEQRSSSLHNTGIATELAPLRSDKRFMSILRRTGLEPEKVFASTAT